MNFIKDNVAIKDFITIFLKKKYIWMYLSYFDLKLKYRRNFFGAMVGCVLGIAISASALCFLWEYYL